MNLLIVESPTKAKKLWGILNNIKGAGKWEVVASVGHLIDLPEDDIGVFPDQGMAAIFMVNPDKRDVLARIVKETQKADTVYLGADPDREGEAIAWHVWNYLRQKFPDKVFHRIRYNAITKSEIKKAIENPTVVDMNLVEAQITRRLLDRLVGYTFSPVLQTTVKGFFPVGRVQAVALAKIVERERERRFHVPVDLYNVKIVVEDPNGNTLDIHTEKTEDGDLAKSLLQALTSPHGWKIKSEEESKEIGPPPPFTTSTLLQKLCATLGVTSDKIMKAAQTLFQNGHITYHRTDSTRISPQRASIIRKYVASLYKGQENGKIRLMGKGGAHEAIVVTHPENVPRNIKGSKDVQGVYQAIWERSLATQMKPVIVTRQSFQVLVDEDVVASHYGDVVEKPGWSLVLPRNTRTPFNAIKVQNAFGKKSESEPPPRYSDSSIIKLLKDLEVGRPSTYASILSTLRRHKYVTGKGVLIANIRGEMLYYFLSRWIKDLVDSSFTAEMERGLDVISEGSDSVRCALSELRQYWHWIQETLKPFNDPRTALSIRPSLTCVHCGDYMGSIKFPFTGNPYFQCRKCKAYTGVDFDPETGDIVGFRERDFYASCKTCGTKTLRLLQSKYGYWVKCTKCGKKHLH